jgi:hypothetical protein
MKGQKAKLIREESEEENESGEESGEEVEHDEAGSDDEDLDAEDMLEMEAVFGLRKLEDVGESETAQVFLSYFAVVRDLGSSCF